MDRGFFFCLPSNLEWFLLHSGLRLLFAPGVTIALPRRTAPAIAPEPIAPPIVVRGARTHNLKGVSCEIPSGQITVVTGLSGSGKSSLAFDTLFAEGQRRYVESLSTYARQFIARMPRPDVDEVDNIPPAIALEQKNTVRNARSTIGTATEINDYLRLLFAKAGRAVCAKTGDEVRRDSPAEAATRIVAEFRDQAIYLLAEVKLQKSTLLAATTKELIRQGFTRVWLADAMQELDAPAFAWPKGTTTLVVVVDRLVARAEDRGRLAEAIESCYRLGGGACIARSRDGLSRRYSETARCTSCPGDCGMTFAEPTPQLLNFSNPLGACPTCEGFGRVTGIDWDKVLPNHDLSIDDGAIAPWNGEMGQESVADLRKHNKRLKIRMGVPWNELSAEEQRLVREGDGGAWYGIEGFFRWLEDRRYKVQSRIMIARYRGYTECPDCHGLRLRSQALSIRLAGKNIGEVCDMSVEQLSSWFAALPLSRDQATIAERPLTELRARLSYLLEVGLGYLTLSRQTRTLSGGESQRINLATSLGSALTETLYVLDEPTVGLHPRDTHRLIGVLQRLKELGNTLVVVEHDLDVIRAADYLIDIGPKAGEQGGEILLAATMADAMKRGGSTTVDYLKGRKAPKAKSAKGNQQALYRHGRRAPTGWITVEGAHANNLRHVTARIPLGVMCCVTGVSGSGKSTLIKRCLYENYLRAYKSEASAEAGAIVSLAGADQVSDIVMIDQSPIGRSSRSNPATYLKAYDHIRELLTTTPDATALGLRPRDFSFNVEGGRCDVCEGTGRQVIDMHFLADVEVICEACDGQRFQPRILGVEWNGLNIGAILDLTISQALDVFASHQKVLNGLRPLADVGLGYLRLGQSTATLSGGEAQRLKLAAHIAGTSGKENALLLFDEPTTGLHPADLDVLLNVFRRMLDRGFSLVVIEHNLQLIRAADHVIDMGPEGGEGGGMIVGEGTPEDIAANSGSLTGKYLANWQGD